MKGFLPFMVGPASLLVVWSVLFYRLMRWRRQRRREWALLAASPAWPGNAPDAQMRGLALLREYLNPRQRAELQRGGHFDVIARSGRLYRVCMGAVKRRESDGGWRPGCIVLRRATGCPVWDEMLAVKLLIEQDEREFCQRTHWA